MVRERYHPYLAFHYWTSQPKSASTPRFFHSITGFALGGLSWTRSQRHLPLHQRRAAPHPLQKSVRDQRPKERNQSQKAAKNLRQNADRLRRAHRKHPLQRDQKVNQNLAQPRRRKSAAVCELNWGSENPKFQTMETDIRTKSVGHQLEQSWMI